MMSVTILAIALGASLLAKTLVPLLASTTCVATFSHSISVAARKNSVGSVAVTGISDPREKASVGMAVAILMVVFCAEVGSGADSEQTSRPSRFRSEAHSWSLRAMLTIT